MIFSDILMYNCLTIGMKLIKPYAKLEVGKILKPKNNIILQLFIIANICINLKN